MVRKLKFHEEKLLKKVDFINWKVDNNLHEVKILKKFHIQKRDDYTTYVPILELLKHLLQKLDFNFVFLSRYNKIAREIRELSQKISKVDAKDPFRTEVSALLLEKLYVLGLIPTKWDLENASKITASSFCRRRLPIVMVRSEFTKANFIEIASNSVESFTKNVFVPIRKISRFFLKQKTRQLHS